MRSFSDISRILTESKKSCDESLERLKRLESSKTVTQTVENFKKNYLSEVDIFLRDPKNNFKHALPLLILIEKNKDNVLGELLIKQVAFPILWMSYPKFNPYFMQIFINNHRPIPRDTILLHQEDFTNAVNAQLSTAITTVADNIRSSAGINSILHQHSFFPSVINTLIAEYTHEDIFARYDLTLRSLVIGYSSLQVNEEKPISRTGLDNPRNTLSEEDMEKARENGTPILTRIRVTYPPKFELFTMYGNSDGKGLWQERICFPPTGKSALLLEQLPFDEKILKKDDVRFTDELMEIFQKTHFFSMDYASPSLKP